jgi:aspartyl protease family protein
VSAGSSLPLQPAAPTATKIAPWLHRPFVSFAGDRRRRCVADIPLRAPLALPPASPTLKHSRRESPQVMSGGGMIGWALRCMLVWCGVTVVCVAIIGADRWLPSTGMAKPVILLRDATPAEPAAEPAFNTLVYPADRAGHVMIDAVVNGAPIRLLVDTGASLVTLTAADARAAGIAPGELIFNRRASTANGLVRMAPVTLREIRIGQLSIGEVPAAVLENLNVSLLGMSFLGRLQSYGMRDGKLTITW